MLNYRSTKILIASLAMLFFGAAASADEKMPSGSVEIDEVELAFLLSGNLSGKAGEQKTGRNHRTQHEFCAFKHSNEIGRRHSSPPRRGERF